MPVVYSNIKHPKLVSFAFYASLTATLVCQICWLVWFVISLKDLTLKEFTIWQDLALLLCILLYFSFCFISWHFYRVVIDEDNDTIANGCSWNNVESLKISALATITYKKSNKGRFRNLFLHDNGTLFMTVRPSEEHADMIVSQLLKVNTGIVVK